MKTPLLLLGICAGFYGTAQTLELSDTISTGDAMTYYVLDSNATSYAAVTGADVEWDYNDIAGYMVPPNDNNVNFASVSDFADDFPTARYTELFENSVNTFFTNDPGGNQVIVHGFVFEELSNDFVIQYDEDPLISLTFPMSQGDTYTDDIQGTAIVPVAGEVAISGSASITADGSGTLKIAGTDYANVLRVHTIEVSEGIILGSPATITRDSYVYYQPDMEDMPIFIHARVEAVLGAGGTFGFTAVYSKDAVTDFVGIEENEVEDISLSVYPNPVTGNFTTITTEEGTTSLTVLNTLGQVVTTINNPNVTENLDVSDLERGVYFVQVMKGAATKTKKFIVK